MQWAAIQNLSAQAAASANVPASTQYSGPPGIAVHTSPTIQSPGILPGFRDTLVSPLPLREGPPREQESGPFQQQSSIANIHGSRNRPNEQHGNPFETLIRQVPLLTNESTVDSASSGSSSVGPLHTPRTPLDIGQRTPQFPNLFPPSKISGFFDSHQLPPLRPPSLSPQSSVNNPYHSPQGNYPLKLSRESPKALLTVY